MKRFVAILALLAAILSFALARSFATGLDVNEYTDSADQRVLFNAIGDSLGTRVFDDPDLRASTADVTTDAFDFCVNNVFGYQDNATIDLSASEGSWSALANGTAQLYVFAVSTNGSVSIFPGSVAATGSTPAYPNRSDIDASLWAVFGSVAVDNTSGSAFTLGTTSFATSDVAETFYDLSALPANDLE